MRLSELFSADDVLVDFEPGDKWDAIRALVEHLVRMGRLPAEREDEILEAVLSRERSMSTGMEHGIAIPHAAVDELESVVACMGVVRRKEGLSFESIDGQSARFVVLLVIPRKQKLLHIRTLADVARVLGRESVRRELLECGSGASALDVLGGEEA